MKNHQFATLLRRSLRVLNLVMVLAMMLAPTMRVSAVTWTDKPDYQPGELVTISGQDSEFAAYDETLPVQVYVTGPNGWTGYCEGLWSAGIWSCQVALSPDPKIALGDYTYNVFQGDIYIESGGFTDGSIGLYDQCSNDDGDGYDTGDLGCRWTNGNLQSNNSTYYEGDATVQRVWLTAYEPGQEVTVTFKYGTTKGAKHAYDYLTTWDWSEDWLTDEDRCQGIDGCLGETDNISPDIPTDPNAEGLDAAAQYFTIRGGTITAVSTPTLISGEYGTGDTETTIDVTFIVGPDTGSMCTTKQGVTTCGVAIWFGAHIALTSEWVPIDGFTGAGGISGSPYHVALHAIDGASIGQRDNQMQANAVVVIVKSGKKWHDMNVNHVWDTGEPYLSGWTIYVDYNDNGVLDLGEPFGVTMADDPGTPADETGYYEIGSIQAGTWKVREVLQAGWTCSYPQVTDAFGCYHQETFDAGGTYENNDFGNYMAAPSIDIVKTGDTLSKVTDPVNYTITVTNTSGVGTPDLYCTITDAMLAINKTVTLATGASDITNASYTVQVGDPDPLLNTANVSCTYVGGNATVATDSDGHSVNLFQPSVNVEKTGSLASKIGDPVNYTITVTNTSSADSPGLVNGTIVDTLLGDLLDAANPYVTSSTCTTSLATGASCTILATRTVDESDPDPLPNTVTVHYNPSGFPNDITDSDDHSVELFQPAINILKTGDALSKIGDPVDYVITLENNSSADTPTLTCTVTDELVGVEETFDVETGADHVINVYDFIIPMGASDPFINTALVTCSPAGFENIIEDGIRWPTNLFQPSVNVEKTGSLVSKIGDPVNYTITVTNTGSADSPGLVNGTIVDTLLGDLLDAANPYVTSSTCTTSLATGASCTILATRTVDESDPDPLPNTVTVHYNPSGFPNDITDSDDHSVNLFQPAINLLKTGDALSKIGDPVDYVITLENNSSADTPTLTCTVTDELVGVEETFDVETGADHVINVYDFIIPMGASDPFRNTALVTCSPAGFENIIEDGTAWNTNLFQPSVNVVKTGSLVSKIGDPVNYTITVTNTGSADSPGLVNGTIVDTLLGDLLDAANPYVTSSTCTTSLATGASCTILATRNVLGTDPDPLPNIVTVHYNPSGFPNDITDSDDHSVDLVHPGIDVEKTGSPFSKTGDTINWTITIKNTGDVPLELETLTDVGATYVVPAACETLAANDHAAGGADECSFPATHVVTPGEGLLETYTNTVSVLYVLPESYGLDNEIRDSDSFETDIVHPSILVTKTGGAYSKAGDTITYNVSIENTGDIPLNLSVFSDTLVPGMDLPDTCDVLMVGETCTATYTHTVTAPEGLLETLGNTFSATYVLPASYGLANLIMDSDDHIVDIVHPSILVTKTGDAYSKAGDTITYNVSIENTGDIPLNLSVFSDSLVPGMDLPDTCDVLIVGETCTATYTHTVTAPEGLLETLGNTFSATYVLPASYGLANLIMDSDDHIVDIVHPSILVTKTGDAYSKAGDTITYNVSIENTGDIPLNLSVFSDTLVPGMDLPDTCDVLIVGETCTATYTHTVTAPEGLLETLSNTFSATYVLPASYGLANLIMDSDDHIVDIVHPSILVTKTGDAYSKAGDTITYNVSIQNTGDVPLNLSVFSDSLVPGMDLPDTCDVLMVGETCTATYTHTVTAPEGLLETLGNTFSATYVLPASYGLANLIMDSDDHLVDIVHPSFTLSKEGDAYSKYDTLAEIPFGDVIDYELTLVNTGDVDLVLGDLNDTLEPLAALSAECATLVVGETCTFNYSHTVTAAEGLGLTLVNTATVSYTLPAMYALSNVITRSDNWTTTLLHPGFTLNKACMVEPVLVGADAMFEITFCNTGDADLVFTLDEDVYEGGVLRVAGYEFTIAAGDPCLVFTVTVTDPIPSGMQFENNVTASIALADRYGLDNTWSAYSSDACTVWFWGFTPGFWKNHFDPKNGNDAWVYTAYADNPLLGSVFDLDVFSTVTPKGMTKTYAELTLLDALSLKGGTNTKGALEILLRAGTAALLNASFHETVVNANHPAPVLGTPGDIFSITIDGTLYECTPLENPDGGVYFPCTSEDIIAIVNAAIATGERDVMLSLAGILDSWNNGWHMIDWNWPVP